MNEENDALSNELSRLFGQDIVEQARLVDVVDLNLDDRMTACITSGITRLKQKRGDFVAQQVMVATMEAGEKLLLCMWIIEMELMDKILTTRS